MTALVVHALHRPSLAWVARLRPWAAAAVAGSAAKVASLTAADHFDVFAEDDD
jgi:hypothetical protein